jgi:hypothetical protein
LMDYYYDYFQSQFGGNSSSSSHSAPHSASISTSSSSTTSSSNNPLQLLLACTGRLSGASVHSCNEIDTFYTNVYHYFYHKGLYAVIIKEVL